MDAEKKEITLHKSKLKLRTFPTFSICPFDSRLDGCFITYSQSTPKITGYASDETSHYLTQNRIWVHLTLKSSVGRHPFGAANLLGGAKGAWQPRSFSRSCTSSIAIPLWMKSLFTGGGDENSNVRSFGQKFKLNIWKSYCVASSESTYFKAGCHHQWTFVEGSEREMRSDVGGFQTLCLNPIRTP